MLLPDNATKTIFTADENCIVRIQSGDRTITGQVTNWLLELDNSSFARISNASVSTTIDSNMNLEPIRPQVNPCVLSFTKLSDYSSHPFVTILMKKGQVLSSVGQSGRGDNV